MSILRKFKDEDDAEFISQKQAKYDLESRGYYKKGTIRQIIIDRKPTILQTTCAIYNFFS